MTDNRARAIQATDLPFLDALLSGSSKSAADRGEETPAGHLFETSVSPYAREGTEALESQLEAIARKMGEDSPPDDEVENDQIPAAYTYFGQFVTHDLTFLRSRLESLRASGAPVDNLRTPTFDLDCLYGAGPYLSHAMYGSEDQHDPGASFRLRVGSASLDGASRYPDELDLPRVIQPFVRVSRPNGPDSEETFVEVARDGDPGGEMETVPVSASTTFEREGALYVPLVQEDWGRHQAFRVRTADGTWRRPNPRWVRFLGTEALVGDSRNDENLMISQLHLAFLRRHNRLFDEAFASSGNPLDAFTTARQTLRREHQWLVVEDYAHRLLGAEPWERLRQELLTEPGHSVRFHLADRTQLPPEFTLAAFRIGHAQARASYRLNDEVGAERPLPLFLLGHEARNPAPTLDLRGGSQLPSRWTLQWDHFLDCGDARTQGSRKLAPVLSTPMARLEIPVRGRPRPLPFTTLLRGVQAQLASGQEIAAELRLDEGDRLDAEPGEQGKTPLWLYVLREAQELHDGEHLGPVGGRIVAEVLFGLIRDDKSSYWWAEEHSPGTWRPTWYEGDRRSGLAAFLASSGAAMDSAGWRQALRGPRPPIV